MQAFRSGARLIRALGAVALVAGCGGDPTGFSGQISTAQFFSEVHAVIDDGLAPATARLVKLGLQAAPAGAAASVPVEIDGVLHEGVWPTAVGQPSANVVLESSIVTGTPARIRVSGNGSFNRVAFTLPGALDYWEIILPAPTTEVLLVATGATSMPSTVFSLAIAVGTEVGYGPGGEEAVQAVDLANSDVAVVLRWNSFSDVDLHVTDGNGEKVYFGNPTTEQGGRLDLDSNAACSIDGVNQEVISWPLNQAPVGEYLIEVDYWSDCGVAQTDYTVTIMLRGQTVQVVNGSFEGPTSPSAHHEIARIQFP